MKRKQKLKYNKKNLINEADAYAKIFGDLNAHEYAALLNVVNSRIRDLYAMMFSDVDYDSEIDYLTEIEKKLRVNLIHKLQSEEKK